MLRGSAGFVNIVFLVIITVVVLAGVLLLTGGGANISEVFAKTTRQGAICGGINGKSCPRGLVCIYSDGSTRPPYPDATGTCKPVTKLGK